MDRSARTALTLAPIVLVLAYMSVILSFPEVDAADFGELLVRYLNLAYYSLMIYSLAGLSVWFGLRLIRRQFDDSPLVALVQPVRIHWRTDHCLSLLLTPVFFAVLLASFNAYKQAVLPNAGFGLDPLFAAADKALFLGVEPWRITHALAPSEEASLWIDRLYHPWFLPMAAGVFLCAVMSGSTVLRTQYLLSFALIWIVLGSLMAFMLPSAGPCFYADFHGGAPFGELKRLLAAQHQQLLASGEQSGLMSQTIQQVLLDNFRSGELQIGQGISAMPSVHNGLSVLVVCAAFSIRRSLGWITAAYAGMIWFGSIHLGWHYAIDGLVAAAVTVPLWLLCGRFAISLAAWRPVSIHQVQAA